MWKRILALKDFINPHYTSIIAIFIGTMMLLFIVNSLINKGEQIANAKFERMRHESLRQKQELSEAIQNSTDTITNSTNEGLNQIDAKRTEIRETIIREISADPRLVNEDDGISNELLATINKAREESHYDN